MGELERLRKAVAEEKAKASLESEKRQLKRELYELKHRKSLSVLKSFGSGMNRMAVGLSKYTSTPAPRTKKLKPNRKKQSPYGDFGMFGNGNDYYY